MSTVSHTLRPGWQHMHCPAPTATDPVAAGDRKSRKDRKEERKARKGGGGGASAAADGVTTAVPTAEELAAVNARSKTAPRTYVRVCFTAVGRHRCSACRWVTGMVVALASSRHTREPMSRSTPMVWRASCSISLQRLNALRAGRGCRLASPSRQRLRRRLRLPMGKRLMWGRGVSTTGLGTPRNTPTVSTVPRKQVPPDIQPVNEHALSPGARISHKLG